jgi:hypothetical protein
LNKLPNGTMVTIIEEERGYKGLSGEVILNEHDSDPRAKRPYLIRFIHPGTNKFTTSFFARSALRKAGNKDLFPELVMKATMWEMNKLMVEEKDELINQAIHCLKCLEKSKDVRTQFGELMVFIAAYASARDISIQEGVDLFFDRNKHVKWQRTGKKGAPFKRVSDREDMATRICTFLQKNGLAEADCDAKVGVEEEPDRAYYFVLWSKTTEDGTKWTGQISIFGEKFIKTDIFGRFGQNAWSRSLILDMEQSVYDMFQMFLTGDIEGIDEMQQRANPAASID